MGEKIFNLHRVDFEIFDFKEGGIRYFQNF